MKSRLGRLILAAGTVALLVGCEGDWESGDDVKSWNDRYNWVNFSGVYNGIAHVLVTDYSADPATTGIVYEVTDTFSGNGLSDQTLNLNHTPMVEGSVSVSIGNYTFSDNGDGTLSGDPSGNGEVVYGTGIVKLHFGGSQPDAGTPGTATYEYQSYGSVGDPGSTGVTIYQFTVQHDGETLLITDNNGSQYEGKMGSVRTTSGVDQDDNATPVAGDEVIAQYTAEGVSKAGYSVTMVGTFQGIVSSSGDGFTLGNRKVYGQWIEDGGKTGDINGEAKPIGVVIQ